MITQRNLASAGKRVVRPLLGSRRLVLMELRNKVLLARTAWELRRFEDAEVARLATRLRRPPRARVATIIATYRRPELVRRAVGSALAQSVREQVVIVVDDGGGLPDLPDDPRLFAFSLSANTATAGVVRNVGIRLSESAYIAFLDDDNEWEEDHLEVALAALEDADRSGPADLVYTALARMHPDGRQLDMLSVPFDRRLLARQGYIDTNALLVRRRKDLHFSRLHRPREVHPREDWEFVFRLSRRLRVRHVPVATVRYLVNPDSWWTMWAADSNST